MVREAPMRIRKSFVSGIVVVVVSLLTGFVACVDIADDVLQES